MSTYKAAIQGTRQLLMHNGQTKDPLNSWAKKVSVAAKKRQKSQDDHEEVAKVEFEAGLYFDDTIGPYLPVDNLQAAMCDGARKRKLGKQFEALVEIVPPDTAEGYALQYSGPRTVAGLWADSRFVFRKDVKIGQSSVMRTRPRFPAGWSCAFDIEILDEGVEAAQIRQALEDCGKFCGIGDWTPRFGRFKVVSLEQT